MALKQQLLAQETLLGTFVKTPHPHIIEVLGQSCLDILCLDAEHAPFDRRDLDLCLLAAQHVNQAVIVRAQDASPTQLLNILDLGADGVLLPHICSAEQLRQAVAHCFYGAGGRGYAGSTRAAGYTAKPLHQNLQYNRNHTCVIAQIEDLEALEHLDNIFAVEQVDAFFIGRMDLTVALGETDAKAPAVMEAVARIADVARQHNRCCGMFLADLNEIPYWLKKGVSLFLLSSDQSLMLDGAKSLKARFDSQS